MNQKETIDNLIKKSTTELLSYATLFNDNKGNYKRILVMFFYEISCLKGMSALLANECYDSVFLIARTYLEGYALCSYSIEMYNNKKFDDLYQKLMSVDLKQDVKAYNELPLGISSVEKNNYLNRWETDICAIFPSEYTKIDYSNKEYSLKKIIDDLYKTHKTKFKIIDNKKEFIYQELCKIKTINRDDLGAAVYPILCSETHFNVSSVNTAITSSGFFTMNVNNKERAEGVVEIIIHAHETLLESFIDMVKDTNKEYYKDK